MVQGERAVHHHRRIRNVEPQRSSLLGHSVPSSGDRELATGDGRNDRTRGRRIPEIVDDAFLTSFNWGSDEDGLVRVGFMTVSGRFEGDRSVKGGFINSVNDVRMNGDPTGDVCLPIEGSYEGTRE